MRSLGHLLFRSEKKNVRADIQAMRAVAVIAVVIYHLWPERLTGGFLGVDIFFVISGFLMTSHIIKGLNNGGADSGRRITFLTDFYTRRIRRLAPASLFSLGCVLLIFFLLFREKATLLALTTKQIIASALFVQNWKLASDSIDYLAQNNDVTPVEHFWSLSVEEQFYLIWPLLLLCIYLYSRHRNGERKLLLGGIAIFTLISIAACVSLTNIVQPEAYFATQARIWEISIGGVAAMLPPISGTRRNTTFINITTVCGFILCLISIITIDSSKIQFPGLWPLIPILGIGSILWAGTSDDGRQLNLFEKIAAFRPMQFVGDISYSFYLWHFIVIRSFYYYDLYYSDADVTFNEKFFFILPLSFAASVLSFYLIERPFLKISNKRNIIIGFCTALFIIVGLAYTLSNFAKENEGATLRQLNSTIDNAIDASIKLQPIKNELCIGAIAAENSTACGGSFGLLERKYLDDAESDLDISIRQNCDMQTDAGTDKFCTLGDPNGSKTILVWGDSHAMHFSDALDAAAKINGYKLVYAVRSACPSLLMSENEAAPIFAAIDDDGFSQQHAEGCVKRNAYILHSDLFKNADAVILASAYFSIGNERAINSFAANFSRLKSKKLIVIQDAPQINIFPDSVPMNEKNKQLFMLRRNIFSIPRQDVLLGDTFIKAIDETRIPYSIIRTEGEFCSGETCYLAIGKLPVYRNDGHLTASFSRTLSPYFARRLSELMRSK